MPFVQQTRTALISDCGLYRYTLAKMWGQRPFVNYICCNPSIADAKQNDPTVKRLIVRSMRLGYGGMYVTNLFAYRSTDITKLRTVDDPIGPENDKHILQTASRCGRVIAAWGNEGSFLDRSAAVRKLLRRAGIELYVLRLTGRGEPWHPLYLPYSCKPILWKAALDVIDV